MTDKPKIRKQNRATLRNYFRQGAMPAAEQYEELIESSLNIVDDGFDKSPQYGVETAPLTDDGGMLSFFRYRNLIADGSPEWTIRFDGATNDVLFNRLPASDGSLTDGDGEAPAPTTVLTLGAEGRVGINKTSPTQALDVDGTISGRGRAGVANEFKAMADGGWWTISDDLSGCHAFEVMAGAGAADTGHHALMHAVAMNTFNPQGLSNFLYRKRRIRYQHAYYLRSARLRLQWLSVGPQTDPRTRKYTLQIRTDCHYGADIPIRYFITRLWFDPTMDAALPDPVRGLQEDDGS